MVISSNPRRTRVLVTTLLVSIPLVLAVVGCRTDSSPKVLPFGVMDVPRAAETLRGTAQLSGWALSESGIRQVSVYVDRKYAATATLVGSRPDVAKAYAAFSNHPDSGWTVQLDTSAFPPGPHELTVQATADDGATRDLATILVNIVKP